MAEKFYNVSAYGDKVTPGDKIKIEHTIYAQRDNAELAQYITIPLDNLQTMRGESAAVEQAIFEKLRGVAREWDEQAAQTLQLDMAIEYVKTPAVEHTANKWEKDNYGSNSVSNRVYQMSYTRERKDIPNKLSGNSRGFMTNNRFI